MVGVIFSYRLVCAYFLLGIDWWTLECPEYSRSENSSHYKRERERDTDARLLSWFITKVDEDVVFFHHTHIFCIFPPNIVFSPLLLLIFSLVVWVRGELCACKVLTSLFFDSFLDYLIMIYILSFAGCVCHPIRLIVLSCSNRHTPRICPT